MVGCRAHDCVQAFIHSSTLSGETLAGNKEAQSLQSELEWSSERNLSPYYAFLMPLSPCSQSSCLSPPLPSFPTWLRQRGVSIGSPFSPRLPGLLQRFFLTSCFCLTYSLPPSIPLCSLLFLPSIPFLSLSPCSFSVSICLRISFFLSPPVCLGHHAVQLQLACHRPEES